MNVSEFKDLFEYIDGKLYWRVPRGTKIKAGQRAGHLQETGYWAINLNKKIYKEHRVVFFIHHGFFPNYVDHIDGNKLNNKIENLRECSQSQNALNQKTNKRNECGYKNVSLDKRCNKYRVQIQINGKDKFFGYHEDLELACLVAEEARNKFCGEFARHK